MELEAYFQAIDPAKIKNKTKSHPLLLGEVIDSYIVDEGFPSLDNKQIAIIGIPEDRNAPENQGCGLSPDYVRKYLYQLFQGPNKIHIADLGNIKPGHTPEDTYYAVKTVVADLIEKGIVPVLIGGSQDLTYANYLAYESLGQIINIVSVDSCFDIGLNEPGINHKSYLSDIIKHKPNFLFNYTNIGYQTYFIDQDAIELMNKMFFDVYRLGLVRSNLEEVEPIVRNADMFSFDVSSIRQSDAPGNSFASPNGFYGEEACQIVRYAGLSDKLSSIGFYEHNPAFDNGEQTAHLIAQMIWYFIDGFAHRKNDFPDRERKDTGAYIKYVVSIKEFTNEIVFYKSKVSDRWWMEVPCPSGMQIKYDRQFLVPCSYKDYQAACQEEIPERWWQVYQKFL
ncbi:MAG: formimidoylglutamase [Bacteroidetes bacterium]|nr:formimidoylglutamase [Bacteroidota bacterium]